MYKLAVVLIFAAGLQVAMLQLASSNTAALPSRQGLAHLLVTSRISALNPLLSVACFADYIAHSNAVSEAYGLDYKSCLLEANEERKRIDDDSLKPRNEIVEASEAVCASLRTCNAHNNTLQLYTCHIQIGTDNTKSAYSISGKSNEYATTLQERYRLIDLHHQQCCHSAERKYVADTAENYNYLQGCLDGHVKPRKPTVSSTTVAATSSTAGSIPSTIESSTTSTTTTSTTEAPPLHSSTAATPTEAEEELTTTQTIPTQFSQLLNSLN